MEVLYECVQCYREFEVDPGEEPCEECKTENARQKEAWPYRKWDYFDAGADACTTALGDCWSCDCDTGLMAGCHECLTGILAAQVADLKKRAVPEEWEPTMLRGPKLIRYYSDYEDPGWHWMEHVCKAHRPNEHGPFDTFTEAIAAAEEATG